LGHGRTLTTGYLRYRDTDKLRDRQCHSKSKINCVTLSNRYIGRLWEQQCMQDGHLNPREDPVKTGVKALSRLRHCSPPPLPLCYHRKFSPSSHLPLTFPSPAHQPPLTFSNPLYGLFLYFQYSDEFLALSFLLEIFASSHSTRTVPTTLRTSTVSLLSPPDARGAPCPQVPKPEQRTLATLSCTMYAEHRKSISISSHPMEAPATLGGEEPPSHTGSTDHDSDRSDMASPSRRTGATEEAVPEEP
jgi:hypothetical protein